MLSTNMDPRSLETELSTAVCRLSGDKWQSKTLFPAICVPRSSIVQSVFDCRDKGAYFMLSLIEIVWSFLHKTLATIYLNLQTISLSGL